MPKKIRELKALLMQAGFVYRPGKGSHTVWEHQLLSISIVLSGKDGNDAKAYQEKAVRKALASIEIQGDVE
jgi:predicted RNA binding protein YcfA (HicA-like mRNA interferase family)